MAYTRGGQWYYEEVRPEQTLVDLTPYHDGRHPLLPMRKKGKTRRFGDRHPLLTFGVGTFCVAALVVCCSLGSLFLLQELLTLSR